MNNLMTDMGRQGDVLIRRVAAIPAGAESVARDNGRVVLAYGEVTGHAHALASPRVALFMDTGSGSGRRFLKVEVGAPVALSHEEHSTVLIPPGDYEVIRQCEYAPEAIRNVAD